MNKWSCFGVIVLLTFPSYLRSHTSTYIILALESSIGRKLDFILPRCLLIHLFRTWWITRSTGSQSSLHMDTYCCALVLPRSHVDTGKSYDADLFLISNEINTQIFTMTILFIPWNHWNLIHRYQRVTPYRIYHCILFNIRNFVENNHHYNDNKSFSVTFDTLWILLKVALPGIVQCRDRWIRWK